MIRSHRRDEPGRRAAFRILTAVIISGSGLGIALATAGPSTPTKTATESFGGPVRPPAPGSTTPTHATTPDAPATSDAVVPSATATQSTTQPQLSARTSSSGTRTTTNVAPRHPISRNLAGTFRAKAPTARCHWRRSVSGFAAVREAAGFPGALAARRSSLGPGIDESG